MRPAYHSQAASYRRDAGKDVRTITRIRLTPRKTAKLIAAHAHERKAQDIIIVDMRSAVNFCDYFVICSGSSDRRIRAIADAIQEGLEKGGLPLYSKQGLSRADWVVLDYGDVVVHIFDAEAREFYNLERLWQDAPRVSWQP